MNVLDRIVELRLERGWTEYQLSQQSGITQSTISAWYRKNTLPSIPSLQKICNAFNISMSEFFMEEDTTSVHLNETRFRLLRYAERLNGTLMPFIDSKITVSLTPEKEEAIKTKLGEAIQILNKSETYLMVGFEDNYDLYMGGSKLDKGAYVSVSLFGQASPSAYSEMTKVICDILSEELSIPGNQVYVTYHGVNDWGWNGSNF